MRPNLFIRLTALLLVPAMVMGSENRISICDLRSAMPYAFGSQALDERHMVFGQNDLTRVLTAGLDHKATRIRSVLSNPPTPANLFGFLILDSNGKMSFSDNEKSLGPIPEERVFRKSFKTLKTQLNHALAMIPEYMLIRDNSDIRIPRFLGATKKVLRKTEVFFSTHHRKTYLNPFALYFHVVPDFSRLKPGLSPAAIRMAIRTSAAFIIHDYGHIVDWNGGIVWVNQKEKKELERRQRRIMTDLNRAERKLLRGLLEDQRAEVYRHHITPMNRSDPYSDAFYHSYDENPFSPAPSRSSRSFFIQLAQSIVVWEHDRRQDHIDEMTRRFVNPLQRKDPAMYRQAQTILAYMRDYRNALRYDPHWTNRFRTSPLATREAA